MKRKIFLALIMIFVSGPITFYCVSEKKHEVENEFIKVENKKESSASVKEDIACELELLLRQTSKNIAELSQLQEQIFDKMKNLMGAVDDSSQVKSVFTGSTMKLKEQRYKLNNFNKKILENQRDLQGFLSCF